jgi:subtilase family serine protease
MLSGVPATSTSFKSTAVISFAKGYTPDSGGNSSPAGGFSPAQMRSAYGASSISFAGTSGDGTGETIAIIDAYDDPNAASDLTAFDNYYGLSNSFTFEKLSQNGSATSLPGTDPGGPNNANGTWEEEESLDIEWSHVMAPKANIILYEANNPGTLYTALQTANANPAVNVISMSFGSGQTSSEGSQNATYFSQPGITYVASTGDAGTPAGSPATLVNVVAVGGTALTAPSGRYSSESGWSDGGGGVDQYITDAQPSYQTFTVKAKSTTERTTPDVSIDASPNTGVPIYDTWDFGSSTPWVPGVEGGTSLAAPMFAGLVAVADQGRALNGLGSLGGFKAGATSDAYTLPRLYQLSAANFHDVTTGNNGLAAGVGYDLVTGIGTPIANLLVPDLAGAGTITGRAFVDNSGNGVYGGSDTPVAGATVYLDLNNDGTQDNNEPSATTNAQGIYTFTDEPAGGTIRLTSAAPTGDTLTSASSGSIVYGATDTINFTYQSQAASKLVFAQQPATTNQGATMSPITVDVDTAVGSVVPTDSSTVTLTLSSGTFSTGLNTVTATAVNGVATFNSLAIVASGTYTLTASDGSLTSAVSSSFNITKPTPTLTWAAPASITYGTALSSTQLDATASVPGTFSYSPAAGTVPPAGQNETLSVVFTPNDTADYQTASGTTTITVNPGPITLTGSELYLKRYASTSDDLDVWDSTSDTGSPSQVLSFSSITSLTLTAGAAADSFTADFSSGSVAPYEGLTVKGIGAAANNSLEIVGTGGSDSLFISGSTIELNSIYVQQSRIGNTYFRSPGAGESLNLSSGLLTLAPNTTGNIASEVFSSLSIGADGELAMPVASTPATRTLLQTGALNIAVSNSQWAGTLDLLNNDLDVSNGNLATIDSQVAQGYTTGIGGVLSSTAQSDTTQLTTLGVIQNSVDGTPNGAPLYGNNTLLGTFDGTSPASTDVLVKYTYYGDANLTGAVDGSDYNRIDSGYLTQATGWYNGDFNYDGVIDGSDYTLIDNAYNTQGASLAAQVAKPSASVAAKSSFVTATNLFSNTPISDQLASDPVSKTHRSLVTDVGLTSDQQVI